MFKFSSLADSISESLFLQSFLANAKTRWKYFNGNNCTEDDISFFHQLDTCSPLKCHLDPIKLSLQIAKTKYYATFLHSVPI